MKIIRLLAWALVLVLLLAGNAAANVGPGPEPILLPILIILCVIVLSLAGGAYPILARLDPNRGRWWRIALRWAGFIILILLEVLSLPRFDEFGTIAVLLGILIPWVLSLYRSAQMIRWAKQARSSTPRPGHLITATPWRLGAAGVLLIVLPILSVWAITLLHLNPSGKPKVARAYSDAKTAATQSIVYANDHDAYPTSMKVLRDAGYANIADADPWDREWMLSPVFARGGAPKAGDDVYVYSKGSCGTGTYVPGGPADTGKCGAVGYSSIYGSFQSSR